MNLGTSKILPSYYFLSIYNKCMAVLTPTFQCYQFSRLYDGIRLYGPPSMAVEVEHIWNAVSSIILGEVIPN